ncbi:MAG: LicD family protein [Acidobacteriaceae bacterium]|nr:LicD family protein [Acidobacteriaceae bacterium]
MKELHFFTGDLLKRNKILHWLDYGSLLGAVRQQELIPWDSDGDWGFLEGDLDRVRALEPEIVAAGYSFDTSDPSVYRINYSRSNTQHMDLYPWRMGANDLLTNDAAPQSHSFPPRFLDEMTEVRLYGESFPAPARVHQFLRHYRYGADYMVPQRWYTEAVDASNPDQMLRYAAYVRARRHARVERLERNLLLLNDVLAGSPVGGRYWVIGGLLIGWAREGRILPHDARDADFGFLLDHSPHMEASLPSLINAGFQPLYRYTNNDGNVVEYSLAKDGARFDFFAHEPGGGYLRYWVFSGNVQVTSQSAAYGLAPMEFLGRAWLKPDDHDQYLQSIYGDWMEPNPAYNCMKDDLSIVDRRPWHGSYSWPGVDI